MRDTAGFGGKGEPYRLLAGSSPGFWLLMYDGGQEHAVVPALCIQYTGYEFSLTYLVFDIKSKFLLIGCHGRVYSTF